MTSFGDFVTSWHDFNINTTRGDTESRVVKGLRERNPNIKIIAA